MTDYAPPTRRERNIASRLEDWFTKHQRGLPWRRAYRPYHIWVSEVMLQQTRMEVVLQYFDRFIDRFPDVETLALADLEEVLTHWSGLGYYRRARMLHEGARVIRERHRGTLPEDFDSLLAIPGVGRYTAGAISSVAFDLPRPIVDGNVARILARLNALTEPLGSSSLNALEWELADRLVRASKSPRLFNQAMMEVGALICRPRSPCCPECPVRGLCLAYASGRVDSIPVKAKKEETRALRIPLYLISDERGALLMRKEEGKLMRGMFHLPHGSSALLPASPLQNIFSTDELGTFRHTVTNRRIVFLVKRATLDPSVIADDGGEYVWIDPHRLRSVPHPSYVRKALRVAGIL